MASTPTTKSQVQAYRFVLRRMQSALVRRDAIMLHEPVRKHSRATAIGVLLAIVGLLAFLIVGFFKPQPRLDDETQIAISKETGQVYVVSANPRQLIPMTNLASARLFWFQQGNPDTGASGAANAGGDAPAGAAGGAGQQAAGGTPKVVSEAALSKLSKGRLTGIPDGPDMLPSEERRIGAEWSVCDTLDLDEFRKDQSAKNDIRTTVIAGVNGGDQALDGNKALLVQSTTDKTGYLIYKAATSTVRAQVDLSDDATKAALRLSGKKPRAISAGLLNAIPEVKPLKAPAIPGQGGPAGYLQVANVRIGEVVQVARTGDVDFYVVLEDGLQRVDRTVGDLIQFANAGSKNPASLRPSDVANALEPKRELDVDDFPAEVPQVLDANANNVVLCLGWQANNVGQANKSESTRVTIGARLPGPADAVPVSLNQAGSTGEVVDAFIMPPGKAAVVRGSTSPSDYGSGPIHLVTGRGVKYGIPDVESAGALGLGDAAAFLPAPESILRLLPNGSQLTRTDATRSYDSIPTPDGGAPPEQ